ASALGVGVGAEVEAARAVTLAGEVDPREVLVHADPDVRVRLVVAQPDVEPRPVALDELLLREQRLGLGLGDEDVHRRDLRGPLPPWPSRRASRPFGSTSTARSGP